MRTFVPLLAVAALFACDPAELSSNGPPPPNTDLGPSDAALLADGSGQLDRFDVAVDAARPEPDLALPEADGARPDAADLDASPPDGVAPGDSGPALDGPSPDPDDGLAPPDVGSPPPDVSAPPPDVSAPPPDVAAPPPDMAAPPPDMAPPPPDMAPPPPADLGPPPPPPEEGAIEGYWVNEGGTKVPREDLVATDAPASTANAAWDGETVTLFGARNEIVSFQLVLEAPARAAAGVRVGFDRLTGPGGHLIRSVTAQGDALWDWRNRDIELFYVRYLQIEGISTNSWAYYDERHVPERMRRPHDAIGLARGGWADRPDHDKHYPEIAVPLELENPFDIGAGTSQTIWCDIYIPRDARTGVYRGRITVQEGNLPAFQIPVELEALDFALPDTNTVTSVAAMSYHNINLRHLNVPYPNADATGERAGRIQNRYHMVAHRHRLELVDTENSRFVHNEDTPPPEWRPRLDGSLYTGANGYRGPGQGVGHSVYVVGLYGTWYWKNEGEAGMHQHTDAYMRWFDQNSPDTEVFLYLIDESHDWATTERWAGWARSGDGPGRRIHTLATGGLVAGVNNAPSLDYVGTRYGVEGDRFIQAINTLRADPERSFFLYNSWRPSVGSHATDDEGTSPRVIPWAMFKLDVPWWYYWESTYWDNTQAGGGHTNVFTTAQTFGRSERDDGVYGRTGNAYANGDGVLFYPGTDRRYPAVSYGVDGPLASLRLKHWRRGIQDVEYVALAEARDAARTRRIIDRVVPRVLWEYGVDNPNDPTYVRTDISWSNDPDDWEAARRELAEIVLGR